VYDEKVISGSEAFVRIIIRRPHAYQVKAKYKEAPIPGVLVLDAEGALQGKHDLKGDKAAAEVVDLLKRLK